MEGKGPDQLAQGVQAAYAKGELPRMEGVGFALNSMLGGNEPFAVTVIPVDPKLALRAR